MKPDTLRRWDETVGSALCRVAGFFLRPRVLGNGKTASPRNVLVLKMSEMGSTVLALPALMELREAWPDAAVHFVVFRDSRGILDTLGLGAGGRIFEVDGGSPWKLVRTGVAALRRAARLGPEVVLDFDFFSRLSAVFSFLAGRGARVGFMPYHAAGRERGNLLTHRVGYSPLRHTSESFLALVRTVTRDSPGEPFFRGPVADADFRLPQYEPTEEESRKVHELVLEAGVRPGERIFLVNPNASDMLPLRRWPRANFEAVIEGILAMDSQNRVVLAGGGGDVRDCTEIAGSLGRDRVSNLAGRTSLGEFLTLCGLAEAIICNDGGLAHFAGLAGCPAVVIFGPESPDLYRPLCPKAKVLYKALPCSPCVHAFNAKMSACGRAVCLEEITVEEVLDAVRAIPRRERERR